MIGRDKKWRKRNVKATALREYDQSAGRGALVDYENVVDSKIVQFADVIMRSRDSAASCKFTSRGHKRLVEMPRATRLASRRLSVEMKAPAEIVARASDGLVPGASLNYVNYARAALKGQFLEDMQFQLKTEVPAHRATDASRKKGVAVIRFRLRHCAISRDRPINPTASCDSNCTDLARASAVGYGGTRSPQHSPGVGSGARRQSVLPSRVVTVSKSPVTEPKRPLTLAPKYAREEEE
jgi:hypothetical protein